ncbi:MAG: hypothetical protein NT027_12485 [Proteobacteria bacterium]|nr:hypothetical protein [Pseudomonadota bacterium]
MNSNSLTQAEDLVQELAPLLERLEFVQSTKRPEAEMRSAYSLLRELKEKRLVSVDQFESIYARLNDLSDSLRNPESFLACINDVFVAVDGISGGENFKLKKIIIQIARKAPPANYQPYSEFYVWVRQVFSDPSRYSSHLLQSRDESVLSVSVSERESAMNGTQKIMESIRNCADALDSVDRNSILGLTKKIEDLFKD